MGKKEREKGIRGELRARDLMRHAGFKDAVRSYGQSRKGSDKPDVDGTPFWVEVKTEATRPNVHKAFEQGAEKTDGRRVLTLTKQDHGTWLVGMSYTTFCALLRGEYSPQGGTSPDD